MIDIQPDLRTLEKEDWMRLSDEHEKNVSARVDEYLEARSHQQKEPVIDFLFTYYKFRPAYLKRWTPGANHRLLGAADDPRFRHRDFQVDGTEIELCPTRFPDNRKNGLFWMHGLLTSVRDKKPMFNCCGMHEWAMVYKTGDVRHESFPLRLSPKEIAEFVESNPPVCTHFDAFRFFTEPARPLNRYELSRENMAETEQPGCIHTNMDTYKWAYKLYPWVSSDTLLEAFDCALEARKIDMMAGPYDLRSIGYEPIKVETESGRVAYKKHQTEIWKRTIPVREKLISEIEAIIGPIRLN